MSTHMANMSGVEKISDKVELTEEDILGTALAETQDSHTVSALKCGGFYATECGAGFG